MQRFAAFLALALAGCGPRPVQQPPIALAAGQEAGEPSWSPDRGCVAIGVSDAEGHSPMTTSYVAVARTGGSGYREIRLPSPNERFSTFIDRWEAPGVLRIRATTPDGDIPARYRCATEQLEVAK